jgi:hypothetical protein
MSSTSAKSPTPPNSSALTSSHLEAERRTHAWVDTYLANQHDTYRWLKASGVEFDDVEISSGQSAIRSHPTDIRSVLRLFANRFVEAGGTLLLGCAARSLSTDANGAVIGVVAERNGQRTELIASAGVVLASGGFSRGVDLLQIRARLVRHGLTSERSPGLNLPNDC